jgi:hypothetical protein
MIWIMLSCYLALFYPPPPSPVRKMELWTGELVREWEHPEAFEDCVIARNAPFEVLSTGVWLVPRSMLLYALTPLFLWVLCNYLESKSLILIGLYWGPRLN